MNSRWEGVAREGAVADGRRGAREVVARVHGLRTVLTPSREYDRRISARSEGVEVRGFALRRGSRLPRQSVIWKLIVLAAALLSAFSAPTAGGRLFRRGSVDPRRRTQFVDTSGKRPIRLLSPIHRLTPMSRRIRADCMSARLVEFGILRRCAPRDDSRTRRRLVPVIPSEARDPEVDSPGGRDGRVRLSFRTPEGDHRSGIDMRRWGLGESDWRQS